MCPPSSSVGFLLEYNNHNFPFKKKAMALTLPQAAGLFASFQPIVRLHSKEPYRPADLETIVAAGQIVRGDGTPHEGPLHHCAADCVVNISPEKGRAVVPLAKRVLCRTQGVWTNPGGDQLLDLIYYYTFAWNGTREPHPFDKEEIVVRLERASAQDAWKITRVFGSAHGNGMWWNTWEMDKDVDVTGTPRVVLYCGLESHAMYHRPGVHKRIFGFGNDVTDSLGHAFLAQELVVMYNGLTSIFDVATGNDIHAEHADLVRDYQYAGQVGHQTWPGSPTFDIKSLNFDGYYKFQGGFDNLFTGRRAQIPQPLRLTVIIATCMAQAAVLCFGLFLIFRHGWSKHQFWQVPLWFLFVACLLLATAYLGLEMFVLNAP